MWKIRTTLKCKLKKKPNGEPDKHKARAAAHCDTLRRSMIKADIPLPTNYSLTNMPLTFFLFLQIAVTLKLHLDVLIADTGDWDEGLCFMDKAVNFLL